MDQWYMMRVAQAMGGGTLDNYRIKRVRKPTMEERVEASKAAWLRFAGVKRDG